MQVFFANPAFSAILQIKNRLAVQTLGESVAFIDRFLCKRAAGVSIILIIVISPATALLVGGAAYLYKAEDLGVGELHALDDILHVAVGGGALSEHDHKARDKIL